MHKFKTAAEELEDKTVEYWRLSSIWNGRVSDRLTTYDALQKTNGLAIALNPARLLHKCTLRIEDEIIRNKRTKKSKTSTAKVLHMDRKIQVKA